MKKLMIAAAIVCAAAMSQAAQINWSVEGITASPAASADAGMGQYVYGFVTDAGGTSTTTFTKEAALAILLEQGDIAMYEAISGAYGYDGGYADNAGKFAGASTTGIDATGASGTNPITMQTAAIIVAYDEQGEVADYQIVEGTAVFQNAAATMTTTMTASADNWASAVPEPTSGLLLLLGVAGLALKRRRA